MTRTICHPASSPIPPSIGSLLSGPMYRIKPRYTNIIHMTFTKHVHDGRFPKKEVRDQKTMMKLQMLVGKVTVDMLSALHKCTILEVEGDRVHVLFGLMQRIQGVCPMLCNLATHI